MTMPPATMPSVSEEWRPIPGWSYEASSLGRVRRSVGGRGARAGHILAPKRHRDGYLVVDLSRDNRVTRFQIGRLVCLAFHGEPSTAGLDACHRNGDPTDNNPGNLYWGARSDNVADARRHGTIARGARHGLAKLSDDSVREMRRLRGGRTPRAVIAERFGVSLSTVRDVCRGERWKHVY